MEAALLSTFDGTGGAAIAARRLRDGLLRRGVQAVLIVRKRTLDDPAVIGVRLEDRAAHLESEILLRIQKHEVNARRTALTDTWLSIGAPGVDLSGAAAVAGADIINLHWVSGFQSAGTVAGLIRTGTPVVWTLHDENGYTGGCHFTAGCRRFEDDCDGCPQLEPVSRGIVRSALRTKLRFWDGPMTIVAPSRWIADQARKSRLFRDRRIEVIPNGVDTATFRPRPKEEARAELGIPENAAVLLFGSHTNSARRKGAAELREVLEHCLLSPRFSALRRERRVLLATFGPPQKELRGLRMPQRPGGYIEDERRLALLYAAADVFLLPSLEDNLPNTMLEAMACGTPVIGFRIGGLPDFVRDGATGFLARPFDTRRMAEIVVDALADRERGRALASTARRAVEETATQEIQAGRYESLFEELAGKEKGPPRSRTGLEADPKTNEIVLAEDGLDIPDELFPLYRKWVGRLLLGLRIPAGVLKAWQRRPSRRARAFRRIVAKIRNSRTYRVIRPPLVPLIRIVRAVQKKLR